MLQSCGLHSFLLFFPAFLEVFFYKLRLFLLCTSFTILQFMPAATVLVWWIQTYNLVLLLFVIVCWGYILPCFCCSPCGSLHLCYWFWRLLLMNRGMCYRLVVQTPVIFLRECETYRLLLHWLIRDCWYIFWWFRRWGFRLLFSFGCIQMHPKILGVYTDFCRCLRYTAPRWVTALQLVSLQSRTPSVRAPWSN